MSLWSYFKIGITLQKHVISPALRFEGFPNNEPIFNVMFLSCKGVIKSGFGPFQGISNASDRYSTLHLAHQSRCRITMLLSWPWGLSHFFNKNWYVNTLKYYLHFFLYWFFFKYLFSILILQPNYIKFNFGSSVNLHLLAFSFFNHT